eukprot:CAMPEP_0184658738 /NCGR_PEP_ID=MMETSP0308-20130426/26683_1 /TAXON_ID=38269 /ORGANISM="Gloeochaete witrockiana, Strain SAG 46.84" /LENGTH=322 /DNA_ID=CAMNT_0027097961 /DNA_START=12 /DNA_END=977 /DNA_ORIENTATION=-
MAVAHIRKEIDAWMKGTGKGSLVRMTEVDEQESVVKFVLDADCTFQVMFSPDYPKTSERLLVFSDDDSRIMEDLARHMLEFDRAFNIATVLTECQNVYKTLKQKKGEEEEEEDDGEEEEDDDPFAMSSHSSPPMQPSSKRQKADLEIKADQFKTQGGSKAAMERLIRDLKAIHHSDPKQYGYEAAPVDDNLYAWKVSLFGFEAGTDLQADLEKFSKSSGRPPHVELAVQFPSDYPFAPPFVRVVRPRFRFHTGHVTIGGSICMELLTKSGWTPSNDLESVIVQIRAEMIGGNARLDTPRAHEDYTEDEARAAFQRVAAQHNW